MTVFSSGISMYALAHAARAGPRAGTSTSRICGLRGHRAGLHLPGRADLGDLQRGAAVLPDRARLRAAGATSACATWAAGTGLIAKLDTVATANGYAAARGPVLAPHASPATNPMGVEWFGMVMGLGFVLSFGYWCTDFLVVQRAMAANSMTAARRTPLIAAVPEDALPVPRHPARHDRDRRCTMTRTPTSRCPQDGRRRAGTTTMVHPDTCWRTSSRPACSGSASRR